MENEKEPIDKARDGDDMQADSTRTIFLFSGLKKIAENLDFSASPRMSRDGSKEIEVHGRTNSSKHVKCLIFLLASKVMAHSNLEPKDRVEVLQLAATVIAYDHGYRSVNKAPVNRVYHKQVYLRRWVYGIYLDNSRVYEIHLDKSCNC